MPPKAKKKKPRALKVNPTDNIGPPYQLIGILIIIAVVVLFIHERITDHPVDREFVYMCILAVVAGLGLIRPGFLDNLVKSIADKIPGFSFKKKEEPGD